MDTPAEIREQRLAILEKHEARQWGSGSYTTYVHAVEARATFGEIVLKLDKFGNQTGHLILTPDKWTRLDISYGPGGIPNKLDLYAEALSRRFMTYQCAMAIAAWAHAAYGHIETRIVTIEFTSSYSTKEIGVSAPANLWEDDRELLWLLRGDNPSGRVIPPASVAVAKKE